MNRTCLRKFQHERLKARREFRKSDLEARYQKRLQADERILAWLVQQTWSNADASVQTTGLLSKEERSRKIPR